MVVPPHRLRAILPLVGRLLAGGCAALVLLLGVLAASPALHGWLHHDGGDAGHACAVTLFQHATDTAVTIIVAAASWLLVASVVTRAIGPVLTQARYRLPPGNAPPVVN